MKINGELGGINSTITNAWFQEQPTVVVVIGNRRISERVILTQF